jgi:hypothetical protein
MFGGGGGGGGGAGAPTHPHLDSLAGYKPREVAGVLSLFVLVLKRSLVQHSRTKMAFVIGQCGVADDLAHSPLRCSLGGGREEGVLHDVLVQSRSAA